MKGELSVSILSHSYAVIAFLIFCFAVLGTLGIYFAIKGIKAAKENDIKGFTSIQKLKSFYDRLAGHRESRSVVFINISLEEARKICSEAKIENVYNEIKIILLNYFANNCSRNIAVYNSSGFVSVSKWGIKTSEQIIEKCIDEINKCLLKFQMLNVVKVKMGSYSSVASDIGFGEAINRAMQAYTIAVDENAAHSEWSGSAGKALEQKIKIENSIENNIDNNKFFLEYQPTIGAKSKKIIGAEVLSRLNSESDGIITPGKFLSALDSVGLCNKFDYYIFEKNCKWISNNKEVRQKYKYTINFSRTTLSDSDFSKKITDIVEKYNLNYSCIAVEMLEDKEINREAKKQIMKNLSELREKGISVLLDDFGNGFTSFDDLQSFVVDAVKIDKSIIQNTDTETGMIIFTNIIRMAKELGLKIVCEGIETEAQEKIAVNAGCDMLQGFYYFHPMPVARLEDVLEQNIDK